MSTRRWAPFFHLYQPPDWNPATIRTVARESYRPLLRILADRPFAHATINLSGSLTEQLVALELVDIIDLLRTLAERGQIEFTTSAKYHAILPLLPAGERRRQLELNLKVNRQILGPVYQPRGLFPPEMCYSTAVAELAMDQGLEYLLLDEIAYDGMIGNARFDTRYTHRQRSVGVVFRHRPISDLFFTDRLHDADDFFRALDGDARCTTTVVTAMDGELLGHHHPGLDEVFARILDARRIDTCTMSELRVSLGHEERIDPLPSSWASRPDELAAGIPYGLWSHPENDLHAKQWELLNLTIRAVTSDQKDPGYDDARALLDRRLNSDPQWWASANPWWDVAIIRDGAQRLLDVLAALQNPVTAYLTRARSLAREIGTLAQQWQDTGKAATLRARSLQGETAGRYFGGQRIA